MENKQSTILIVEDIEINVLVLQELLQNDYNIVCASSGEEAMLKAHHIPIDLVLLDIALPDFDGYEVCRRLKADDLTNDIPVLFLTASYDEQSIEKAFDVGGVDYITKPYMVKELKARIKTHITLSASMKKLDFLANVDSMTGIYNRRKFFYLAEERFEKTKENLYSVMIDIDKFKAINDKYGHQVGDEVIKNVANIISSLIPKNTIFGRLGGEEFALVINMHDEKELFNLIEKIRDDISKAQIEVDGAIVSVTISAGISAYEEKYQTIDQFLSDADSALYEAKGKGRNKTTFRDRVEP